MIYFLLIYAFLLLALEAIVILRIKEKEPGLYDTLGHSQLWFLNGPPFAVFVDLVLFGEFKSLNLDLGVRKLLVILRWATIGWFAATAIFVFYALAFK